MTQGRTRLPLALDDWDRVWGDQLIRAIDQNLDAAEANVQNSAANTGYYGSFYSTANQFAAVVDTPYAMTFTDIAAANQVGLESTSQIKFKNRGSYNIQFSVQLTQTSASSHYVYIWFRKNGIDIPFSASEVAIKGADSQSIPAWNFIASVVGGDYIEIMWATNSTTVSLLAVASASFRPAIPSVIATVISI
jgi:hypothetical protein